MDHPVCACVSCSIWHASPSGARLGDRHLGVRFWPEGYSPKPGEWKFTVNGEVVPEVIEGLVGEDGWVYAYVVRPGDTRAHVCAECSRGACVHLVQGPTRAYQWGREVEPW